ncbi:MFS transporter [Streptomyces sp. GC420]|uniref:MFS transporter n=1 Tax=Streptomyces sp. GC420 TaxID=2697568 RepID=UPI001414CD7A|nr:MFS transporter [Streptomyces sp. GC420]NBM16035.1 DHA2 family efflux MFS transporter permease subunit [Streptomyces sp. GC420]
MSVPKRKVLWTFLCCGLGVAMVSLDNLVVITALPAIRGDLGGSLQELEWTVNAYTLTYAVLMLPGAALGDRFGRRRMFGIGMGVFVAASAGAALSSGIGALIAARAVQGLGAALLMPLNLTILTDAAPAHRRGALLGAMSAVEGVAIATGPLLGGAVVEHLSWQWIFWINVPIGAVVLPFARWKLAESRGPGSRLDLVGTALAGIGLFGIVFGIVHGHADHWSSVRVLASLTGGAVVLVAFVLWELHVELPMFPMNLFRNRTFSAMNAAGLLMFAGMFGSVFLLTQFFQGPQGYSPLEAGLRILPWTAVPIFVAPLVGLLSDRIGSRSIVALGLTFQACGLGWIATRISPEVGYPSLIPALVLCGLGMTFYFAPTANMVMSAVDAGDRGMASGAINALRELGGVLGIAVLASVFSAQGDLTSADRFTDGMIPAVWTGVVLIAAGALAVLAAPRRHSGGRPAGAVPAVPASANDRV